VASGRPDSGLAPTGPFRKNDKKYCVTVGQQIMLVTFTGSENVGNTWLFDIKSSFYLIEFKK
jgi:hypothetical protein